MKRVTNLLSSNDDTEEAVEDAKCLMYKMPKANINCSQRVTELVVCILVKYLHFYIL